MTELIVSYKSNNYKHEAFDLAQRLEVECLSHEESKEVEDHINVYFLIVNKSNHYLRKGLSRKYKPIFCNFSDWATNYSDPLLTKCLKGLPDGFRAVDTTAGFGKDALQIAKDIRCKNVTLIEKEPWMFHLLKDSYNKVEDNVTSVYVNKFKILNMDSKNFLDKNKEPSPTSGSGQPSQSGENQPPGSAQSPQSGESQPPGSAQSPQQPGGDPAANNASENEPLTPEERKVL